MFQILGQRESGRVTVLWIFLEALQTNRGKLTILTLFVWFLLHTVAFSLFNLHGYRLSSLIVLVPPLIILACVFAGNVFAIARAVRRRQP